MLRAGVFLLVGAASSALSAPLLSGSPAGLANVRQLSAMPLFANDQVSIQSLPSSHSYNEADFLKALSALHVYLDNLFGIGLDLIGAIEGFDGAQLLGVIENFRAKPVLDTLTKFLKLPDITRLLTQARKMNLSVFLPVGLNILSKNKYLNQKNLGQLVEANPPTGKTFLNWFRQLRFTGLANHMKKGGFPGAFKTVTGVDPTQALTNLANFNGDRAIENFKATKGADLVQLLEDMGLVRYARDYLGYNVQPFLDRLGAMSGQEMLAWIETRSLEEFLDSSQLPPGANLVDRINHSVNSFLSFVRTTYVETVTGSAAGVPPYTGFDVLRDAGTLQGVIEKLVGYKITDLAQWISLQDFDTIMKNVKSLTGAKLAKELNAAFKRMGKKKQEELLKLGVDIAYRVWTWLYTLDGKKIISIINSATLPQIEAYLRSLDAGFIARVILDYGLDELYRVVIGVDATPLLRDLANISMATVINNVDKITGDDLVALLDRLDVWNYLSGFGVKVQVLQDFVRTLSGRALSQFLAVHDGPWLLRRLSTLKGPELVAIINDALNDAMSFIVDVVGGSGGAAAAPAVAAQPAVAQVGQARPAVLPTWTTTSQQPAAGAGTATVKPLVAPIKLKINPVKV